MNNNFPDNFLWGAGTSSHQVEGDNFYNDWWAGEQAGKVKPSGKACDHYNRFREDFKIAKEIGHNAHRLSIEWSRLEKKPGVWDEKEWAHYNEVIDELIALGIEPMVALNHFTLPLWISDKGGWSNEEIVDLFSRFAQKAVRELGDRVKYWITINEPMVLAYMGYMHDKGLPPPGKIHFEDMLTNITVMIRNILKAHVRAYKGMHEAAKNEQNIKIPEIGLTIFTAIIQPCSKFSFYDQLAAFLRFRLRNHGFIRSLVKGKEAFFPFMDEKLEQRGCLDFIGINYYYREFVYHENPFVKNPLGRECLQYHHKNVGPRTNMGWEIYPVGLYKIIKSLSRYKLPIIVTENGISTDNDTMRCDFIRDHLKYLKKAIDRGIPVKGYFHWSLLDNFEWVEGFKPKFGLVAVDYSSQKRTIRDSARYYAAIIKGKEILSED